MADIYAIFGTLLALGISFPGMLTAIQLIFPEVVVRASDRWLYSPWRAFWMGAVLTVIIAVPTTILLAMPVGFAKFIGVMLILITLAAASLGAAGLAARMATRLHTEGLESSASKTAAFVKAAIALELAAVFPFIGWFLVIPLTLISSLGAAAFAILGWRVKSKADRSGERTLIGKTPTPADTPAS